MPIPLGVLIGLAGASAGLNKIGQDSANESNAEQAELNRQFQERMRDTQYQAAVKDMIAAGLNPALAYQQGGAASPSGTSAHPMQNTSAAAIQAAQTITQMALTKAQTENVQMDTRKKDIEGDAIQMYANYELPNIEARTIGQIESNRNLTEVNKQQLKFMLQELRAATLANDMAEVQIAKLKLSKYLESLEAPRARREADMYNSRLGKYIPYIPGVAAARRFFD
ncbi:MAG: DNA pilot protein [Arizlama microvirus]|nr:MAG: DNA pilot protein [Arizlama microvirus]